MSLVSVDLGSVIREGGSVLDNLFTSDKERMEIGLQDKKMDISLLTGQMEVNKTEAAHRSLFVAGWRPALGWVGAIALGYKFLFHPLLTWAWAILQAAGIIPLDASLPPEIDASELYPIILGMLGLGTMRTVEGVKGVKSSDISQSVKKKQPKKPWYKRVFNNK
jgi:hypothetical protein